MNKFARAPCSCSFSMLAPPWPQDSGDQTINGRSPGYKGLCICSSFNCSGWWFNLEIASQWLSETIQDLAHSGPLRYHRFDESPTSHSLGARHS